MHGSFGNETLKKLKSNGLSKKEKQMNKIKTRADILDTAKKLVTKDRASDHGDMESNFKMIADLWSTYTGADIKPHDVAVMMNLLKVARIKSNPDHDDNWIDSCGYMACGGEISKESDKMPMIEKTTGKFVS